jgi:hypothetical protein
LSALSEIKRLKLRAAKPPNLDDEQKNDWRVKAGYALGFSHALEEAIQIIEESDDDFLP